MYYTLYYFIINTNNYNKIIFHIHFIIVYFAVGAGTSGAVIAARLAENGQSVLLVEAGGTAPPFLDIPLLSPLLQNSIYDWQYITVPQHNACKALKNNVCR